MFHSPTTMAYSFIAFIVFYNMQCIVSGSTGSLKFTLRINCFLSHFSHLFYILATNSSSFSLLVPSSNLLTTHLPSTPTPPPFRAHLPWQSTNHVTSTCGRTNLLPCVKVGKGNGPQGLGSQKPAQAPETDPHSNVSSPTNRSS